MMFASQSAHSLVGTFAQSLWVHGTQCGPRRSCAGAPTVCRMSPSAMRLKHVAELFAADAQPMNAGLRQLFASSTTAAGNGIPPTRQPGLVASPGSARMSIGVCFEYVPDHSRKDDSVGSFAATCSDAVPAGVGSVPTFSMCSGELQPALNSKAASESLIIFHLRIELSNLRTPEIKARRPRRRGARSGVVARRDSVNLAVSRSSSGGGRPLDGKGSESHLTATEWPLS